jgi:hypothetical protein
MPAEALAVKKAQTVAVFGVDRSVPLSNPVLLSLQTIVGLTEEVRDHAENSGRVRLVAQPGAVLLDHVAQQYARATTGVAIDQYCGPRCGSDAQRRGQLQVAISSRASTLSAAAGFPLARCKA